MAVRNSTVFLAGMGTLLVLFAVLAAHSRHGLQASQPALERTAELVRTLELTDLCLFTEASYTRHLSMADLHTPFQDAPFSFEHFPTGALVGPPGHLKAGAGDMSRVTVARSHVRRD
ncbi:MAG TPA: hypothetical protein VIU40_11200 [Geobacteraceae bacterium]